MTGCDDVEILAALNSGFEKNSVFASLGKLVWRYWFVVGGAWVAALVAVLLWAPSIRSVRSNDESSLLPADSPSRVATNAIQQSFANPPALSVAAIVVTRPGGLTGSLPQATQPTGDDTTDWAYLAKLTDKLSSYGRDRGWQVLSPADPAKIFLRNNLISGRGDAAIIKVDLPVGFVSHEAIADVDWIERAVYDGRPPAGLDFAVTGSASYGHDYFIATETSLARTTWVTIIAVIVILLLTYRAIPAAAISLVTVTVAVIVSVSLLAIAGRHGWSVSMIVELFTIVIGYGAGVDFSLFFLSRFHEELARADDSAGPARRTAVVRALAGVGPAVVASASTVAAGLLLMYWAKFKVFTTAGPAVAVSVIVSCIASLTLAPAMACRTGAATFWPQRIRRDPPDHSAASGFWHRLAGLTVRRPLTILLAGLLVLTPLAIYGWRQKAVFDTLADLPADNQSVRGAKMFREHFPSGEMAPIRMLVQLDRALSQDQWAAVAADVDEALKKSPHVQQVRSVVHPLGVNPIPGLDDPLGVKKPISFESIFERFLPQFAQDVAPRHLGRNRQAALWEVAVDLPPYDNRAMAALDTLADVARRATASALQKAATRPAASAPGANAKEADPKVLLAGDSAQMRDVQRVTDRDFWFVGMLVVIVIMAIVLLLVRDLPVVLFLMAATILSYGAALGLTAELFSRFFGTSGLDWKVEFFLFVILVAVGQDYNLFILTRLAEERRHGPLQVAAGSAIARTGAIISCCGLIMAATLGSLASSPLRLLQELGVAFVIGLLLDTFLVRPLMVPAFVLVFKRMNRGQIDNRQTNR